MVVAMKPEVCRVFRHLLRQEPWSLVTWEHEHEQIKPTAVRQYWKKFIFPTHPLVTWKHEHEQKKPTAVAQYWLKLIFQ